MAPLVVFLVCFAFWLVLSGHPTPLYLALGAASAALVAAINHDIEKISEAVRVTPRFLGHYLPWLMREIVVANLQVLWIVLHPRLPIEPVVLRLRAELPDDLAVTTYANSITLTPGTVTLDVDGPDLVVHALTRESADALASGTMARRIGEVFGQEPSAG